MGYLKPEVQKVATRGLLVALMNLCHEVFGPLQMRRVDWNQEMFKEKEEPGHGETGPVTGKASSSGQPMEVDDERKSAVPEQVTVDSTKVTEEKEEEKEEEGKPSWSDVEGEETM